MTDEAKKFKRGESTSRQCGNIVATAWKDNKVVNVASTLADEHTTVKRTQKDGSRIDVHCPICVALYNNMYMAEVYKELQVHILVHA